MAMPLKQSTSVDVPIGPFLDQTDGFTAETALTITQPDIRLKKGDAAWAQKAAAQTLTHEENGWYEVTLDATDTNTLGPLVVAIHESGALPVWREFIVVPANVYDSMVSTDKIQVDVVEIAGSTVSTSSAQLGVNVVQAAGTAWASGAITAASIAADAITAAKIATGAIDADALAADAVDEILDDALTDSVPADGALPTVRQALYMIAQFLTERAVSGTTVTVKKVDGTTTLMTFTLNDATTPTSITRAT